MHGACHVARRFASATSARQPATNAGQASSTASACQPGRSDHAAGVNTVRAAVGTGAGAGGATVWQPPNAAHRQAAAAARRRRRRNGTMGWILLEGLVALVIGIAIVWWTMSARRKPPAPGPRDRSDDERQ